MYHIVWIADRAFTVLEASALMDQIGVRPALQRAVSWQLIHAEWPDHSDHVRTYLNRIMMRAHGAFSDSGPVVLAAPFPAHVACTIMTMQPRPWEAQMAVMIEPSKRFAWTPTGIEVSRPARFSHWERL